MPGSTTVFDFPYAVSGDTPDIGIVQELAEAVEDVLNPAGLASGKGLLWNGSEWTAVDVATQAELAAHESDTTGVHGIADTSALATDADLAAHSADTTAVHGIPDTAQLVTATSNAFLKLLTAADRKLAFGSSSVTGDGDELASKAITHGLGVTPVFAIAIMTGTTSPTIEVGKVNLANPDVTFYFIHRNEANWSSTHPFVWAAIG